MRFKENLLMKIRIDALAEKAIRSWGPPQSGGRADLGIIRELLEMSDYTLREERGLALYIGPDKNGNGDILVLDNELKRYHTTVTDAVMRKNPTVKEMVSIRNAIKILNDKDVVVSKKSETVRYLQSELIEALDLSYTDADLAALARDGAESLKNAYGEGVRETLLLFSELLGYRPPPKALSLAHHDIIGQQTDAASGNLYGPIVLYNRMHNTLKIMETPVDSGRKTDLERVRRVTAGDEKPDLEGEAVFGFLKSRVPPMG